MNESCLLTDCSSPKDYPCVYVRIFVVILCFCLCTAGQVIRVWGFVPFVKGQKPPPPIKVRLVHCVGGALVGGPYLDTHTVLLFRVAHPCGLYHVVLASNLHYLCLLYSLCLSPSLLFLLTSPSPSIPLLPLFPLLSHYKCTYIYATSFSSVQSLSLSHPFPLPTPRLVNPFGPTCSPGRRPSSSSSRPTCCRRSRPCSSLRRRPRPSRWQPPSNCWPSSSLLHSSRTRRQVSVALVWLDVRMYVCILLLHWVYLSGPLHICCNWIHQPGLLNPPAILWPSLAC